MYRKDQPAAPAWSARGPEPRQAARTGISGSFWFGGCPFLPRSVPSSATTGPVCICELTSGWVSGSKPGLETWLLYLHLIPGALRGSSGGNRGWASTMGCKCGSRLLSSADREGRRVGCRALALAPCVSTRSTNPGERPRQRLPLPVGGADRARCRSRCRSGRDSVAYQADSGCGRAIRVRRAIPIASDAVVLSIRSTSA
jgi:hypothetical protein